MLETSSPPSRSYLIGLTALLVIAMVWFQWITASMYAAHRLYLADVGLYHSILSGTLRGHFLVSPLAPDVAGNFLGIHFQPILLLALPFYGIVDHPLTLVCVFTFFLVLAAWPLAELTRSALKSEALALAMAVLYLGNHFVASIHLANHPESLLFAPLFLAFLALERRKPKLYAIALLLVFCVKEDIALYMILFGLALVSDRQTRRWGWATMGGAILAFLVALLIMHLNGLDEYRRLGMVAASRFAEMGDTPGQVILTLIQHPSDTMARVLQPHLLLLAVTTGLVCVLDWRMTLVGVLCAIPFLLTGDHVIARLDYYYSYGALPFFFLATIRGARRLQQCSCRAPWKLEPALIATFVFIAVATQFFPTRTDGLRHLPLNQDPRFRLAGFVIAEIPPGSTVAAQHHLYCRVPNDRRVLPIRDWSIARADFLLVDDFARMPDIAPDEADDLLTETKRYSWTVVADEMGIQLLKKSP